MQPRERYSLHGPEGCNDVDLIALVLGTGAGGRSARAIALDLVEAHGSLKGIRSTSVQRLAGVRGVGPVRAIRLHAALTMGARAHRPSPPDDGPVRYAADAATWFVPGLDDLEEEEFHGLFLDSRRRPLGYRRLTHGTDASTMIEPRQVLTTAMLLRAHGFMVGHNHPSGDLAPSLEDIDATHRLAVAASVVGLELVDHLITAGERWVSLAELGHIDPAARGAGQRLLSALPPRPHA